MAISAPGPIVCTLPGCGRTVSRIATSGMMYCSAPMRSA
jgi:hypothetical protein